MRDWILKGFCILFFITKYSKFTDNIRSGNSTTHFLKIPTKLQKIGGRCYTPYTPRSARPWPQSLFNECNFIKKETLAQVLSCEFCEISKNTFFYRTLLVAASEVCLQRLSKTFMKVQFQAFQELHVPDASLVLSCTFFGNWKKNALVLGKDALIAVIYRLNFSLKVQFLRVYRRKSERFFPAGPFFSMLQMTIY